VPNELACVDPSKHGTYCAMFIASEVHGPATEVSLYVGKILSDTDEIREECLADGIRWAIESGVRIITTSVSIGNDCPLSVYQAINDALNAGIIIITTASNSGKRYLENIPYPARIGSVLCIGGHERNGSPSLSSARGRELDFLAPGEDLEVCRSQASYRRVSAGVVTVWYLDFSVDLQTDGTGKKVCCYRNFLCYSTGCWFSCITSRI
jgi:hypothetical protein